jgi:hypothetical protein
LRDESREALILFGITKLVRFHKMPAYESSTVFYYLEPPPSARGLPALRTYKQRQRIRRKNALSL